MKRNFANVTVKLNVYLTVADNPFDPLRSCSLVKMFNLQHTAFYGEEVDL